MADTMSFSRPPSTQEAVLDEMRRQLGTGQLRPGAKVPVEEIAERLGVSRVPVREALKTLEGEGQIVYRPQRGFFVPELTYTDLEDIYDMRRLLEGRAIELAIPRLTTDDLDRLAEHLDDVDRASRIGDLTTYAAVNKRFHLELFEASGRAHLVRTITQLWDGSGAYRAFYANDAAHRDKAGARHRAILAAVAESDVEAAIEAQDRHRADALKVLSEVLEIQPGKEPGPTGTEGAEATG
jgi:DNA-binding GntR family transcriptional regulator